MEDTDYKKLYEKEFQINVMLRKENIELQSCIRVILDKHGDLLKKLF